VGIIQTSLNATTFIDKDTKIVTSEMRVSIKKTEYLNLLAIMDPIAFCMRLYIIPDGH